MMLGVSLQHHICFSVHANTSGKQDQKDRDHREPILAKRRAGREDTATYFIQVIDNPHQIIALKVRRALGIFFPIKYTAELVVKVG